MREHVRPILDAALAAVDPHAAVVRALARDGDALVVGGAERIDLAGVERVLLVAAGKAAGPMALGALEVLGDRVAGGTVAVPDGALVPLPARIETWEAAHPVPDTRGLAAAVAALRTAREAGPRDLLLCLLSGGASALWTAPVDGVSLSDVQAVTAALLRSGAPISAVNTVRRHLSRVAGGGLARAAWPARLVTLAVSDVVGSAPEAIASGPTAPDPTTFADALEALRTSGVQAPTAVLAHLRRGAAGALPETPGAEDEVFGRASYHVVARNRDALDAAARRAGALGYRVTIVGDDMEGEARDVAAQVAALAWGAHAEGRSGALPAAFLLGGETTVTVRGAGRGGRNQELALAAALELDGEPGVVVAALGTDGRDGPTDAAGAVVDGTTPERGRALGLDGGAHLACNDAHPFLRAVGDLLVTGPTGTNVNDVVLVLVDAPRG